MSVDAAEVGVLARVQGTLWAGEEARHVPFHAARHLEIAWVAEGRVRRRVGLDRFGLDREQLLEVRRTPVGRRRVLVHAAPLAIDEALRCIEGLAHHRRCRRVAFFGLQKRQTKKGRVDELVARAPAAVAPVIGVAKAALEPRALLGAQGGLGGRLDGGGLDDGGAGRGVVDDRLEHGRHLRRREVAAPPDDLAALAVEHDGGGPAVVAVALGERGVGVLIDARREVVRPHESDDLGVRVGGRVHDVAPVAPHRLEVEQDEALLAPRLLEEGRRPCAPLDRLREHCDGEERR